ncbi:Signal transduction response regulator, receiver region domain protein, partial [Candidatus Magnetomorum sp. HK-1]
MVQDNHTINIIAVDDEPGAVLLMEQYLTKNKNYNVRTAINGFEVIEMLDHQPVDVLITDILMPGMTGIELAERVLQKYPDTVII